MRDMQSTITSGGDNAPPSDDPTPQRVGALSLSDFVEIVIRRFKLISFISLSICVTAVSVFLLLGRDYNADASFVLTNGTNTNSRLSGLAAQFGMSTLGPSAEPAEIYTTLLRSREVLRSVVLTEFETGPVDDGTGPAHATLITIFGLDGEDEEEAIARAVRRLRKNIKVSANMLSGVVTLRTTAHSRTLAEQINRRIIEVANSFNIERRTGQASIERAFVEQRLEEARRALAAAEGELEQFLLDNRSYATSPTLTAEAARLQRQVQHHLQVHISLAQAYEQTRIEEVRNTPLISIVDPPEGSGMPSIRLLVVLVLSAGFGLGIALASAFLLEYFRRQFLENGVANTELEALRQLFIQRSSTILRK